MPTKTKDPWQPRAVPVRFPQRFPMQDQSLLSPLGASPDVLSQLFRSGSLEELRRLDALRLFGLTPLAMPSQEEPYLSEGGLSVSQGQTMPAPSAVPPASPQTPYSPNVAPEDRGATYRPDVAPMAQTGGQDYSTLDRIMNALGAAGEGLKGKPSLGPLARLHMTQAEESRKQIITRGQVANFAAEFMDRLKKMPDDVQNAMLPLGMQLLKASGMGAGMSVDAIKQGFMKSDLDARTYASSVGLDSPQEQQLYARLIREERYGEANTLVENAAKRHSETETGNLYAALQEISRFNGSRVAQGQPPLSIDEAVALLPQDQQHLAKYARKLTAEDITALGLLPKSTAALTAEVGAKEATPGGKARIELEKAQAGHARAQTAVAGIKTIPGAGGALVNVGGAVGLSPSPTPSAPIPPGMTAAPGVQIIASTPPAPGPGLPGETAKQLSNLETMSSAVTRLRALQQNRAILDQFIGPTATGARLAEWYTRNVPGVAVPKELTDLDQAEIAIKNTMVPYITGAAVKKDEEPRIFTELPDRTSQKPDEYWRKVANWVNIAKVLEDRYKELVGPDGRMRVGVTPEDVYRRHPLTESLFGGGESPAQNPPAKRVR